MPNYDPKKLDEFWNEKDAPRQTSDRPDKERHPDGKGILAVIKSWEVVEGKYGPQLAIKVYYPEMTGNPKVWDSETIFESFPDPQDENQKRAGARKSALKRWLDGLKVTVNGLSGIGNPTPSPVGFTIRLTKKTNGSYKNFFIDRVVERTTESKKEATTQDDSIPF